MFPAVKRLLPSFNREIASVGDTIGWSGCAGSADWPNSLRPNKDTLTRIGATRRIGFVRILLSQPLQDQFINPNLPVGADGIARHGYTS